MSDQRRLVTPFAPSFSRPVGDVSEDLEAYAALLLKWNATHNLVSRETAEQLWERHIVDCLQLVSHLDEGDRSLLDFGSGGGLPGVVIAIARKGNLAVTMVESVGRKAAFLKQAVRSLGLDSCVINSRLETIDSRETLPKVITARAVSSLTTLFSLINPFWVDGMRALFPKGREHGEEMREAAERWDADILVHPSVTDARSAILEIRNLRAKSGG